MKFAATFLFLTIYFLIVSCAPAAEFDICVEWDYTITATQK